MIIEQKLNALPTFELKFRNEICLECGAKGDPRYIVAACHTKSEYMHTKPLSLEHTRSRMFKHEGELIDFVLITGRKKHNGHKGCKHSEIKASVPYHPGNVQTGSVARTTAAFFTVRLSEWYFWEAQEWHWYDCCNSMLH